MESGTRLGPYEILEQLGAGGLGEVWLAEDSRLGRKVAIKVMPEELCCDPEHMARLEREARMLAALDHPNIATVHGLEESEGVRFLVMQRVKGETLADRIVVGPVSPEDAVDIAAQIAAGLEAAHEQGIVHRDLKPANVMVDGEGNVKILDFGLAKPSEATEASASHLTASPTVMAATAAGVIMGTAPYMSPEQARGRPVDKRTDIWAFGVVLYEMLTGTQPFAGETVSDCIAAILTLEPDLDAVPAATDAATRRVLGRCLDKDPKSRLRDIGEARILLGSGGSDEQPRAVAVAAASRLSPRLVAALVLVASLLGALLGSTLLPGARDDSSPSPVLRLAVPTPDLNLVGYSAGIYLTPDGRTLGYHGEDGQLQLRDLSTWEPRSVPGTENSRDGFLSPDGRWFAYMNDGEGTLEKVLLDGGTPVVLASGINIFNSGAWSRDGVLYFAADINRELGLWRVDEDGSGLRPVLDAAQQSEKTFYLQLALLPGDGALLLSKLTERALGGGAEIAESQVWALMLDDLSLRLLLDGASQARYLPGGYLAVITAPGSLSVVEFDLDTVEVRGTPRRVVEGVRQLQGFINARYTVSESGTLAYVVAPPATTEGKLLWMAEDGTFSRAFGVDGAVPSFGSSYAARSDPAGATVAMTLTGAQGRTNVWLFDLERGTGAPFLADPEWETYSPTWSPDGAHIAYVRGANLFKGGEVMLATVDASEPPRHLYGTTGDEEGEGTVVSPYIALGNWTPDGAVLCFEQEQPESGADIWTIGVAPGSVAERVVGTESEERSPRFSPDGHWLAYASDRTGRMEIYLRSYPRGGRDIAVSPNGGEMPAWSPGGERLYYREAGRMMEVDIDLPGAAGGVPSIGRPVRRAELPAGIDGVHSVDSKTGRLLVMQGPEASEADEIRVVIGFADEIRTASRGDGR